MPTLDVKVIRERYHQLRKVDTKKVRAVPSGIYLKNGFAIDQVGDVKDQAVFLVRLANELKEDQFIEAITSGETPPMKLTTKEMELMKGGGGKLRDVVILLPPPIGGCWWIGEVPAVPTPTM